MFDFFKNKDEVKLVAQKEVEKKREFLGSSKIARGHTLFEIDKKTGEIRFAEYESEDIEFNADVTRAKRSCKVVVKDGCFYVSALNKKNAAKKYVKQMRQLILSKKMKV